MKGKLPDIKSVNGIHIHHSDIYIEYNKNDLFHTNKTLYLNQAHRCNRPGSY